jgi:hypothetical protein
MTMRSTNPRTRSEIAFQSRNFSHCSPTGLTVVDGTAVQTEVREATHSVAMKIDAPMVLQTCDVPVALPMGVLVRWMRVAGGQEIAMPVAARAKFLVVVPRVGEKATVVTQAAEAVEIQSKDDSRVVRPAVVIIANLTWFGDVAQAARLHPLVRNLVDRVDHLRLPVTGDVRHSVADHRSLARLSSRPQWVDHSQAVPDHRRSVVRKVGRLSIDHPGVDLTHVATVEMDPLRAVTDVDLAQATLVAEARREARRMDVEIGAQDRTHERAGVTDHPTAATADPNHVRVMVVGEAHRVGHQTDVEIEAQGQMHETVGVTDRPTATIADRNHVRVIVVAEAHRVARRTDVEIEAQDRMHEMVVVTGVHLEPTDRDDGDQTAIGVTPPVADQMAMLHETATDDPTQIVDRTRVQTVTVDRTLIDPIGKPRDQLT